MLIERRKLGATGLTVGRIGISSSFGAEEAVYEEAFERGCNYFTWGTFIRGRSPEFRAFMRRITSSGRRDQVVLGLLSYSHSALLGERFLRSALRHLGTDYIDCLLLGYYSQRPPQRVLDWASGAKDRGLVRAVGLTTHNRDLVAPLARDGGIDCFHVRYNAVHRGAEVDVFPLLSSPAPGLISFTATSWGGLLAQKKMPVGVRAPHAGDCYRFVLARREIDVCMMGVRNRAMLRENLSVLERGPMTELEMAAMRAIGDHLSGRAR